MDHSINKGNYFNHEKIVSSVAIQNVGKSNKVVQVWAEVSHEIFDGWEVERMWNL